MQGMTLALSLVLVFLAGCAGQGAKIPDQQNWKEHNARLDRLQYWNASGKLALRTSERSEAASILWLQQGKKTRLQLSGPLGVNATEIHSDGKRMELRQGDKVKTWDISTPDAIARNTGWDLPLQALPYWLKGQPSPDSPVQSFELDPDTGVLRVLRQGDWEVLYEQMGQFGEYVLPTRLRIECNDTSARIIIRDWQALPG